MKTRSNYYTEEEFRKKREKVKEAERGDDFYREKKRKILK